MRIDQLTLQNIRSHQSVTISFSPGTTLFVGPNASGKTTIIEALALLSTGDSFRAARVEELIHFSEELGRISAVLVEPNSDEQTMLEVIVTRGLVQGKKTPHRLFSTNGVRKRKKDAIGLFYTVVFRPEDMRLIEGSPSRRRSFLDIPLSALHASYARSLQAYEQTLKRRNKLLEQIRNREQSKNVLQYWTLSLLKHGEVVQEHRREFIQSCSAVGFPLDFRIDYQPSVISQERLDQYADKELIVGRTLIGPHKDDFAVYLRDRELSESEIHPLLTNKLSEFTEGLPVATYGSRGQQRMAVLWLKLCELAYLDQVTTTKPILLLDDILSELDETSRGLVVGLLGEYQSVVTTTDPHIGDALAAQLDDLPVKTIKIGVL